MKLKAVLILSTLILAVGAVSLNAEAAGRNPASLLLYPYYNTDNGNIAVITITNTGADTQYIRMVWIDDYECSPEDQWIELTGYDTYTFLDFAVNPQGERGFMYAYVVEAFGSVNEKDADVLIGQEFVFSSWGSSNLVNYGINAVGFEALTLTADGDLHLDGTEYEAAPKTLYFPRFFGQDDIENGAFEAKVILINLTGGKFYEAEADLLVYNDNEVSFSSTVTFPCFWYGDLTDLSAATYESFLLTTDHDEDEVWDGNPGGDHKKTGWLEITGDFAYYFTNQIDFASVYAVLIEEVGPGYAADLPWQIEDSAVYNNAMLWSTSPNGN